ncbi:hypothetical protein STAFG_6328 [Streptomyces afghaniensis 772]|uniref:Uncharacterized protein n=1 Tax=Streptomyces afghaniensis 772 TaxID=1283301 RepID=S4MB13_9ACTN|nr:hypothetical protein STAFG_6328 [Streptomyces afghaniensis 772]
MFLRCHRNIILRNSPGGQGLHLTYRHGIRARATVPGTPAPLRTLHGAPAGPVVVERNDLGIRHR